MTEPRRFTSHYRRGLIPARRRKMSDFKRNPDKVYVDVMLVGPPNECQKRLRAYQAFEDEAPIVRLDKGKYFTQEFDSVEHASDVHRKVRATIAG